MYLEKTVVMLLASYPILKIFMLLGLAASIFPSSRQTMNMELLVAQDQKLKAAKAMTNIKYPSTTITILI